MAKFNLFDESSWKDCIVSPEDQLKKAAMDALGNKVGFLGRFVDHLQRIKANVTQDQRIANALWQSSPETFKVMEIVLNEKNDQRQIILNECLFVIEKWKGRTTDPNFDWKTL